MSGQAFLGACVFAVISYINFFVLSSSFFTIFIRIATAIIALFAFIVSIVLLFSKPQETEAIITSEQTPPDNINEK